MWVTEGTGVSQYDPNNVFDDYAWLTVDFDLKITGTTTDWIDYWYLAGVVGEGGSVKFEADVDMYLSVDGGIEEWKNHLSYNYSNNTPGSFWMFTGDQWPNPIVSPAYELGANDYIHLAGIYTYAAKNDDGLSKIYSQKLLHPFPNPPPCSFLVLAYSDW